MSYSLCLFLQVLLIYVAIFRGTLNLVKFALCMFYMQTSPNIGDVNRLQTF